MSDEEQAAGGPLVPVQTRAVEFYGDQVLAAQLADGTVMVPLRPIAETLGLEWSAARRRLQRDPILASVAQGVAVMASPGGGRQSMTAIPLKYLPGWLFGVSVSRVREELRAKILRYQYECYEVLWRAFAPEIVPAAPSTTGLSLAGQAVEQARALLQLAEQQYALEQELARVRNKQDVMAGYIRGFVLRTTARLDALETFTSVGATITPAQAAEIALAVKTIGSYLPGKGGMNGYQQVYAELYRRYGISSYKQLPAARYPEALDWLRGWYAELGGGPAPDQGQVR